MQEMPIPPVRSRGGRRHHTDHPPPVKRGLAGLLPAPVAPGRAGGPAGSSGTGILPRRAGLSGLLPFIINRLTGDWIVMLLPLCTWEEVEAYLKRSTGIIVPIGSTEQRGKIGRESGGGRG